MAHGAITTVSLNKFGGLPTENWEDFESLFRSTREIVNINGAQAADFLKIHLKDSALQYYHTLPNDVRADVNLCLVRLRDHFSNPNLREVHLIELENQKFDHKKQTPEQFLVKIQNLAKLAYPEAVNPAVAPVDPALDAAAENARVEQANRENEERTRFHQRERQRQVRRLFIRSMPNWLRIKLLEKPEDTTVEDLCTQARKTLILHKLCPIDDWSRDAFSEINPSDLTVNLASAIADISTKMETKMNALADQFEQSKLEKVVQNSKRNDQSSSKNDGNNDRGRYNNRYRGQGRRNQNRYRGNNRNNNNWNRSRNSFQRPFYNTPYGTNMPPTQQMGQQFTQMQWQPDQQGTSSGQFHMPQVEYSNVLCHTCGYPNHYSTNCTMRNRSQNRGGQYPFNNAGNQQNQPDNQKN